MQRVHIECLGDSIEVPIGDTVIGRAHSCALRFDDPAVSRRHLRLVRRASEVFVEDLGSSNGTLVNGSIVEAPARIDDGDSISVGTRVLRVRIVEDAAGDDEPTTMELLGLSVDTPAVDDEPGPPRRRHARRPIELQLRYASHELELEAFTRDLSESGVFVCSPVLDPVDTECMVTIRIDDGEALELRGVVRRVVDREDHGGTPGGLGVEFIAPGSAELSWLRAQVSRTSAHA